MSAKYYANMGDMRDSGGLADEEFVLSDDYAALKAERDALREVLIQIDHHASQNRVWAGVDGWKYIGLSTVTQKKIHGITQATLAATEEK